MVSAVDIPPMTTYLTADSAALGSFLFMETMA